MQRGDRVGGRFEIAERVASGGMGTIFRGRDVRGRRDVAVKIVAVGTPDEAKRFAREAQILAGFVDPGVVGYIAHGPDYLVMEWVEGESLRQRLDRAPLPARDTLAAARQLARALAALHAAGIVHRDVKPANLMLAGEHIKLVDFGIARSAWTPRVTRTGMHIGTAGYMAPEQARGEPEVTGAADMFALGCVLYECLAGVPAFCGDSALALRAKVLLHDPPPLGSVAPRLPGPLAALVMRLLAREVERRPVASEVTGVLAEIELETGTEIEIDGAAPTARAARDAATDVSQGAALIGRNAGDAATEVSHGRAVACAILIAADDPAVIGRVPELAGGTAERFEGGAVTTRRDAASAARLALELAAQLPDAMIAVACGRSAEEAIDRSARLVERLAIAGAAGERVAGAWVDGSAAGALDDEFVVETHGDRARLRGLA
ncbi:MAG TPA: serine/threonine-protein kinase [Kofleriaceae bacterium]